MSSCIDVLNQLIIKLILFLLEILRKEIKERKESNKSVDCEKGIEVKDTNPLPTSQPNPHYISNSSKDDNQKSNENSSGRQSKIMKIYDSFRTKASKSQKSSNGLETTQGLTAFETTREPQQTIRSHEMICRLNRSSPEELLNQTHCSLEETKTRMDAIIDQTFDSIIHYIDDNVNDSSGEEI